MLHLMFFSYLSFFPLFIFLFFLYKWYSSSLSTKLNLPPSPPQLPIIGNLHQIIGKYPHRSLHNLSRKYGDLMLLHFGSRPTVVVSSAAMASQIFSTTNDIAFAGRPRMSAFVHLFGSGKDIATTPYCEYVRKMRHICVSEILNYKRVRSYRKMREEEVALMMEKIREEKMVNMSEIFITLTNDLICRAVFGKKYRHEEGEMDLEKVLNEISVAVGSYFIRDYIPWLGLIDHFTGVEAKIRRASSAFDGFFKRVIQEHSDCGRENKDDEGEDIKKSFVEVLLQVQREEGRSGEVNLDTQSIRGIILDIFVAGTDTIFVALEWLMSELLRNPRVMKELQKEVRGIVGERTAATEDDLLNMKYLKAIVREALRLHPSLPLMIPHECTRDVKINGYDIVAGTQVIIDARTINRDPTYWEDPESFYPERFLNSRVDFRGQHFQMIPFGSGRRTCPGITFAVIEIELVVANLVHQFDLVLPDGARGESLDMTEAQGVAPQRMHPLLVDPTPRFH